MEYPINFDSFGNQDSNAFKELIQIVNSNHNVELVDSDKYLFQALYSQIFKQVKEESIGVSLAELSNQIQQIFTSELVRMNEENQKRFEIIMSDRNIEAGIINILSRQVYYYLNEKSI